MKISTICHIMIWVICGIGILLTLFFDTNRIPNIWLLLIIQFLFFVLGLFASRRGL